MATNNVSIVCLTDGREVCFSYGMPVAAFIPADYEPVYWPGENRIAGYIKTSRKYSVTTSRHANAYAGDSAVVIDDAKLRALIAPVTNGKG